MSGFDKAYIDAWQKMARRRALIKKVMAKHLPGFDLRKLDWVFGRGPEYVLDKLYEAYFRDYYMRSLYRSKLQQLFTDHADAIPAVIPLNETTHIAQGKLYKHAFVTNDPDRLAVEKIQNFRTIYTDSMRYFVEAEKIQDVKYLSDLYSAIERLIKDIEGDAALAGFSRKKHILRIQSAAIVKQVHASRAGADGGQLKLVANFGIGNTIRGRKELYYGSGLAGFALPSVAGGARTSQAAGAFYFDGGASDRIINFLQKIGLVRRSESPVARDERLGYRQSDEYCYFDPQLLATLYEARDLLKNGRYREAAALFNDVIGREPLCVEAYVALVDIYCDYLVNYGRAGAIMATLYKSYPETARQVLEELKER
jgi:hypothetical protein